MAKNIEITAIQVFPFKEGPSLGRMKGLATVSINDAIVVRGLRIMQGDEGMFVGFPVDPFFKGEENRYMVACIDDDVKKELTDKVLEKYHEAIA